jgi:hypothetical protein
MATERDGDRHKLSGYGHCAWGIAGTARDEWSNGGC